MVVLGEGHVDVALLAGAHADHLLLEAGDELAAAELEIEAFALAAVEGHAVDEAFKVDVGGVAQLGGTLDGLNAGNALGHAVDLSVDLLFLDLSLGLGNLQALILAQGDLGVQGDVQLDGQVAVFLLVHGGNAGRTDDLQAALGQALKHFGEDLFDRILQEDVLAVHGLHHFPGRVTLAEAGKHDVLLGLGIDFDLRLLEGIAGNVHLNAGLGAFSGRIGDFHVCFLLLPVRSAL